MVSAEYNGRGAVRGFELVRLESAHLEFALEPVGRCTDALRIRRHAWQSRQCIEFADDVHFVRTAPGIYIPRKICRESR
jgi:hypothetical protein